MKKNRSKRQTTLAQYFLSWLHRHPFLIHCVKFPDNYCCFDEKFTPSSKLNFSLCNGTNINGESELNSQLIAHTERRQVYPRYPRIKSERAKGEEKLQRIQTRKGQRCFEFYSSQGFQRTISCCVWRSGGVGGTLFGRNFQANTLLPSSFLINDCAPRFSTLR